MMTDHGFLIFALCNLIVIGVESLLLFRSSSTKKTLTTRIRNAEQSYENRLQHQKTQLETKIKEREQKIKELEAQIAYLQNDEEKQRLREMVAYLKNEVQVLKSQLNVLHSQLLIEQDRIEIDPEEFFQMKERNMELELQIEELQQHKTLEQSLFYEKLSAEQQQVQQLQKELYAKVNENNQLREERDLFSQQYTFMEKYTEAEDGREEQVRQAQPDKDAIAVSRHAGGI